MSDLRIMLVDDEANILKALVRDLKRGLTSLMALDQVPRNLKIESFTEPKTALLRAQEGIGFDVVISDYRMPEMNGVSFLTEFKTVQPNAIRIIMSGYTDWAGLVGAINDAQIQRFIAKPWEDLRLCETLHQAIAYQALQLENQTLADQVRRQQGIISEQELELRRLEAETPGITRVRRTVDGAVLLEEDF